MLYSYCSGLQQIQGREFCEPGFSANIGIQRPLLFVPLSPEQLEPTNLTYSATLSNFTNGIEFYKAVDRRCDLLTGRTSLSVFQSG